MNNYLAIDLGAESGRAMLGTLGDSRLTLEELHRFANQPVRVPGGLYWDTFRLFQEMLQGLRIAVRERKLKLDGIGIDTWGVDFGLFGEDGALVDNPRHYRDARNKRNAGAHLRTGPAQGNLRADRHPVHAVELPLPIERDAAVKVAGARRRHAAAVYAGPVQLLADRHRGSGADHSEHLPVYTIRPRRPGRRTCSSASIFPPTSSVVRRSSIPARCSARCCPRSPSQSGSTTGPMFTPLPGMTRPPR